MMNGSANSSPAQERSAQRLPGAERLPVIGLVGGVASGKSFVARELERLGAATLDADRAGHDVLQQPEVVEAIRRQWGDEVLEAGGAVDRKALARIVFGDDPKAREQRRILEEITHPRIGQQILEQARRHAENGAVRALVLDAPVMLEAGWDALCDYIIFVDAPRDVRLSRALSRGWTRDDFAAREKAQETLEKKRERADFVIDNGKDPEYTRAQVERFWHLHFD